MKGDWLARAQLGHLCFDEKHLFGLLHAAKLVGFRHGNEDGHVHRAEVDERAIFVGDAAPDIHDEYDPFKAGAIPQVGTAQARPLLLGL